MSTLTVAERTRFSDMEKRVVSIFRFIVLIRFQHGEFSLFTLYVEFLGFPLNLLQFFNYIRDLIEQFEIHLLIICHYITSFALQ